MMSNLGRHAAHDLDRELARAYDGEVPPPFYWQTPIVPAHVGARHHSGEIKMAWPYNMLPERFRLRQAVSLEELDEMVERSARQEEQRGG